MATLIRRRKRLNRRKGPLPPQGRLRLGAPEGVSSARRRGQGAWGTAGIFLRRQDTSWMAAKAAIWRKPFILRMRV